MEYGLIGMPLTHSFSHYIHKEIGEYDYKIIELSKDEFDDFMTKKDFKAINVTIPYKKDVIKYLDNMDNAAKRAMAVNTVINSGGKLFGCNTDIFGLYKTVQKYSIDIKNKKVLILGTGGTSNTAWDLCENLCAREIIKVSRTKDITYDTAYKLHKDADIIINCTPSGMYPNTDEMPIDIDRFSNLSGVIDVIYNPQNTRLLQKAKEKGIPSCGGLYMLAAQAVLSAELFLGKKFDDKKIDAVFEKVRFNMQNIVLTGMPESGKTTVGKELAKLLDREFIDTDEEFEKSRGIKISDFFKKYGEAEFRRIESDIVAKISDKTGVVIATGGGVPMYAQNRVNLKKNGICVYLEKPVSAILPDINRPLIKTKQDILDLFIKRESTYKAFADITVNADKDTSETAQRILARLRR